MLAIGCRFTEVMTDWRRLPVPRALIQIDLDPLQIGMNYPVALGIVADANAAVRAIREALPTRTAPMVGENYGKTREMPAPPNRSG